MSVAEAEALRARVGHRSGTTPSHRRPGTPPDFVAAACVAFNRVQFHHTPEHALHAEHADPASLDGPMTELLLLARIGDDIRAAQRQARLNAARARVRALGPRKKVRA